MKTVSSSSYGVSNTTIPLNTVGGSTITLPLNTVGGSAGAATVPFATINASRYSNYYTSTVEEQQGWERMRAKAAREIRALERLKSVSAAYKESRREEILAGVETAIQTMLKMRNSIEPRGQQMWYEAIKT